MNEKIAEKYDQRFCKNKTPQGIHIESLWEDAKNLLTCLSMGTRDGRGQGKGKLTFYNLLILNILAFTL